MSTFVRVDVVPGELLAANTELAVEKVDGVWHVRAAGEGDFVIGRTPTEAEAANLPAPDVGRVLMIPTREWASVAGWIGGGAA
jgi:hypothetical protein